MKEKIDFVVTWLDSDDPIWQADYVKYKSMATGRTESARFRDWGLFKYWFRAVEQYAPWVNKVFLVTNGKFPEWINEKHPKLVLVKHSDYIPGKYLPTFNSITIEMFLHKIPGLSEHFVYFNDDFYLNAPITPDYYFRDGLPCDCNLETYLNVPTYTKEDKYGIYMSILAGIGVINAHFNRWPTVRKSMKRWFGLHLGFKGLIFNILLFRKYEFIGFAWRHWETPFLKSIIEDIWEKEPELLMNNCTRFREEVTLIPPYLFRYWQFASNKFSPAKLDKGKYFELTEKSFKRIELFMDDSSIKSLCLNDVPKCSEEEFLKLHPKVDFLFHTKFPNKCTFEK